MNQPLSYIDIDMVYLVPFQRDFQSEHVACVIYKKPYAKSVVSVYSEFYSEVLVVEIYIRAAREFMSGW